MNSFITPGTVAGILSFAAALAAMLGKPALAAFFSDPATAAQLIALIGAALGLYAGFARGIAKPTAE